MFLFRRPASLIEWVRYRKSAGPVHFSTTTVVSCVCIVEQRKLHYYIVGIYNVYLRDTGPMHAANFVVCCVRMPDFLRSVGRLCTVGRSCHQEGLLNGLLKHNAYTVQCNVLQTQNISVAF